MKKLLVFTLVLLTSLFLFAEPEWLIENVEGGQKGGTLYLSTTSGPKTLNEYWAQETSSTDITVYFRETLLHTDNRARWSEPGLAKEYWMEETEDGGTAYHFIVREGLSWSDGTPFTIDDIVFTWNNVIVPEGMQADGNDVYKDEAGNLPELTVDGNHLIFTYPTKFRFGFEALGGQFAILPEHKFKDRVSDPDTFAQTWTVEQIDDIVGLGAFIVTDYVEGVRVVLERNPYYFAKSKDGVQLPYLDKVIYQIVQDLNTERLKFEAGEIDVFAPTAENFPSIRAQASEKGWKTIVGGPVNSSQFIAFNFNSENPVHRKWFRNTSFRQAVAYAFDRQSIIDTLMNGLGEPMYGPRSRSSAFYNPEIEEIGYRYSLATARRKLQEGGFSWNNEGKLIDSEGNVVAFSLSTNSGNNTREEIANILVDSLSKLGIEVTFRPVQFNTLVGQMFSENWDAIIIGLTGGDDPAWGSNVWALDGGLHFWNWSPEVQDWVDPEDYYVSEAERRIDEIMRVNKSIFDEEKLQALWDEWQMLIAENQILVYTVSQNVLFAHVEELHIYNPEPNPLAGVLWRPWGLWKEQ
ncbi:ABC transporter substrate-binding protein [Geotoga petraea]|uniref:ABC transporter substrate-binding protein n=1 Tax=Geotoga petraea TaxID=28234 RepID=A0A4Z0W206_9BACT|nr:ABC transporter substrate-binding protein [Geotoga petraea]TGG87269.1 ABC transporter substrate-binding protein [Geotoga petraea]